jgi:hypothetical protein
MLVQSLQSALGQDHENRILVLKSWSSPANRFDTNLLENS